VKGETENLLHIQCGGKNLAQRPEGAKLLDLLAEGSVLGLELSAAIEQTLDLFQGTDFSRLALDEKLQLLEPPLERRITDLNAFT